MVIVPMPLQSNAGAPHLSAEEQVHMWNRLLVLANGLPVRVLQKTPRKRRNNPASAPPSIGPMTGIGE
jgi:hypothetical protein